MKSAIFLPLLSLLSLSLSVEDIALKVERKLQSIRTIQANFNQIYYSSSISTPLREKGKFYFKKPDWMKWEYKDPEERTYLYKDGLFLEYIPEENQINKYDLSKDEYTSEILSLLSGQRRLRDNYSLEFSPFPTKNPKAIQLKLIPRQEDEYSYILLEIDEKTLLIRKAIFFDWAGNKSEFQFSRIKTNVRIPQKVFELKVPPDVEIIKYESYRKNEHNQKNPHI